MRVVAVIGKGGSGKTTLSAGLAERLAFHGFRTVLVDADGLGTLTTCLGLDRSADPLREHPLPVPFAGESLRIARSGPLLARSTTHQAERWIAGVAAVGDVAVVDTPAVQGGQLSSVGLAAIRRADMILVTAQPSILELQVLWEALELASRASSKPAVRIVLTRVNTRRLVAADVRAAIDAAAPGLLLPVEVPEDVRAAEWPMREIPITLFAQRSRAARAIGALARHVASELHFETTRRIGNA